MALRGQVSVVALAVALVASACGTTRPVEVPPPYSDSGILVTLRPRVYIDWAVPFEWLRGTAENRTGRDMDLLLYLNLLGDTGLVVGHTIAAIDDFRDGTKRSFEALVPHLPVSKVARGWIVDKRALEALAGGGS